MRKRVESRNFAIEIGHNERLQEGERRHAVQELERAEVNAGGLDTVRDDGFERCENGAEQSHDEAEARIVIVAVGGETDAHNDGEEGDVDVEGVCGAVENAVDGDDENRSRGAQDLVERNSHHMTNFEVRGIVG